MNEAGKISPIPEGNNCANTLALDGAVLSIDDDANREVYGAKLSGQDILLNGKARANGIVEPFVEALQRDVPAQS